MFALTEKGEFIKRASRKPSILSESLHQRLNSYALAASAAGVGLLPISPVEYALRAGALFAGVLLSSSSSEAKLVYTPAHATIGFGGLKSYALDINHDGIIDFTIHYGDFATDFSFFNTLSVGHFQSGAKVEGSTSQGLAHAFALHKGSHIGPKQNFQNYGSMVYARPYLDLGKWVGTRNRYLGLSFLIGQKLHYGWARLTVDVDRKTADITAKLTGYAYETIPNKAIIAGKTKGPDVITLDDASLGHLARGADAIPAWRSGK